MKHFVITPVLIIFLLVLGMSNCDKTPPSTQKTSIFQNMNPLETQKAANCYFQLGNTLKLLASIPKLRTFFLEVSKQKQNGLADAVNSAYNDLVHRSTESLGNEEALLPEKEDFNVFAQLSKQLQKSCSDVKENNFKKVIQFISTRVSKLKVKVQQLVPHKNKDAQNLKVGVQRKVTRFFKNVKKVFIVIGIVTIFIPVALVVIPAACTSLALAEVFMGIAEFILGTKTATEDKEDKSTYLAGLMICMEFLDAAHLVDDD